MFKQMAYFYGLRYQQTNQSFFLEQQNSFAARALACQ